MKNEKSNQKNDLTTGIVWKELLFYFLPIVTGTVIQQLYNAVDGFVVGRYVGPDRRRRFGRRLVMPSLS